MSAIALAHMGDAVYETLVRTWLCVHGTATGKDLHRATIALVCAHAQAEKMQKVLPLLTDEEQAVYKRGRNANGVTHPKNSSAAEYRAATGLEALFGWLYLSGENERLRALFQKILDDRQAGLSPGNQMLDGAKDEVSGQSDNRAATISQN